MRRSERAAAVAVVLMTGPAFLAFPLLGLWYVGRVWPTMSPLDRGLFCLAVPAFCAAVAFDFRQSLREVARGGEAELSWSALAGMYVPLLAGTWALTRRWELLLYLSAWAVLGVIRAAWRERRRRAPGAP